MRFVISFGIIFSTLVIDLTSKWLIESVVMNPPRVIPVLPFFNLVIGHNRGVSFGLLNSDNPSTTYALIVFALLIIVALSIALWRSDNFIRAAGFAAIIGGALSNVVDRFRDGGVTDFLDFYVGQYHWPAFNFADIAIFFGVISLLIPFGSSTIPRRSSPRNVI
ncbi:MAG: signal peptidase II [Alphaproteobacteria bacterium]